MNTHMNFDEHIKNICREAFYRIMNIAKVRKIFSNDTVKTFMHAFVTSRIDSYVHFCLVCLTFLFSVYNMF